MKFYVMLNEIRDVPIQKVVSGHPEIAHKIRRFMQLDKLMREPIEKWAGRGEDQKAVFKREHDELEKQVNAFLDTYGYRYGELKDYIDYLEIDDKLFYDSPEDEMKTMKKRMGEKIRDAIAQAFPIVDNPEDGAHALSANQIFPFIKATRNVSTGRKGVEWNLEMTRILMAIRPLIGMDVNEGEVATKLYSAMRDMIEGMGGKIRQAIRENLIFIIEE